MLYSSIYGALIRSVNRFPHPRTVVKLSSASFKCSIWCFCNNNASRSSSLATPVNSRASLNVNIPNKHLSISSFHGSHHQTKASTVAAVPEAVLSLDVSASFLRSKIVKEHYLSKQDIMSIVQDLSKHTFIPEGFCSLLLQCCAEFIPSVRGMEKIQLGKQIWETFRTIGYVFCKEDVESMMAVYIASRQHLDDVPWASLDPTLINNPVCLLSWLQCAAETGDVAGTTHILERMRQCGINLDEETFACLILAHGRAHDFPQVKNVLNTMKDSAVDLGLSSYIALLQAQIENNQPISNTVMQMRNDGVILKDLHLSRLIYSIAISKRNDLLNTVMRTLDVEKLSLELKNCAIELIHKGYPSFVIRLVAEYATAFGNQDAPNTFATFVPKELVTSDMKPVDIVNLCKTLQQAFPGHQSFLLAATEASLRDVTKTEMSIELLKHVTPLRNHYFWPLAVRSKNLQEISAVLNLMQSLGLRLDSDTLIYYTYPNLIILDTPINVLKHLQKSCKLSVSSLLGPLVHALLNAKMLNEAIILCKQYKQRILDLHSMAKPLMSCTLLSKDYSATVNMLSLLSNSKNINERTVDIVGLFLTEYTAKCSPADLQQMLMLISKGNLKISFACYELLSLKAIIKQNSLIPLLDAITNTAMEGTANFNSMPHPRDMGLEELEGHLIELKSKNLNTRGVLRRLLQVHCRLNNPERVLQIKKELDADGYTMSPGILASILAMQLLNRDCENASLTLQQLTENYPHFVLDEHKIIDFCNLKLMNGASKGEITTTLRNFTDIRQNQGSKIRGGAGIQRNCQVLINSAQEKWGETEAKSLVECLRHLHFM